MTLKDKKRTLEKEKSYPLLKNEEELSINNQILSQTYFKQNQNYLESLTSQKEQEEHYI